MIRRATLAWALLVLSACADGLPQATTPPTPGGLYDLSVVVINPQGRLAGATVAIDGTDHAANEHGFVLVHVPAGDHTLQAHAPDYRPGDLLTVTIARHTRKVLLLEPVAPRPPPISALHADGKIFRTETNEAWRWRGVSAFKLLNQYAAGEDIAPTLAAFRGFNVLRVFWYVKWVGTGWEPSTVEQVLAFANRVAQDGFYVELVLLTGDEPAYVEPARQLVQALTAANPPPKNLLFEIGNEPTANGKRINVWALREVLEASPFLYASGDNERNPWFGRYLTAHTPRDGEWPRKAHDLLEYYVGGGPAAPTDPAHHVPAVADEPIRPDEAGFNENDFLAYFASSSLLGAGATFHYDGGKFGRLPTGDEARCLEAALAGLLAFPADAPRGAYRRIDEHGATLRTYVIGDDMVRVRPTSPAAPEPGWSAMDDAGIVWKRAS